MEPYLTADYQGAPFVMFGPPHLISLGIILAIILFLIFGWKNPSETGKNRFRYFLGAVLILNEIAWHLWNAIYNEWTIQTMLPLHLCSVLVWIGGFALLTRNFRVYEFLYLMGVGGAIQALLTPDVGIYGFPHFRYFQTFISHGSIMIAGIYMTTVEGLRPTWRSLGRVFIGMNIYLVVVFIINSIIGSNYLFIMHPPETPSLIDMLGPWPWYIIPLELIGLATCLILYLPFAIKDWLKRPAVQPAT